MFREKNTQTHKLDFVEPSLSRIKEIKDKVRPLVEKVHKEPSKFSTYPLLSLRLEQDIIVDAATLLEIKLNINSNSIANHPRKERFMKQLNEKLSNKRINFNTVIQEASDILGIKNIPDYTELIHKHPNFKDSHILRTELDLFVNRGNFNWTTFERSNFSNFVLNPNQDKLKVNESINCWEAMLYSLIRSEALDKRSVAEIYKPNQKFYETLEALSNAFRWETSKNITDKELFKKTASKVPYFIEISAKGSKYLGGLFHDMISFPNSTDKMIQTLANEKFQGNVDGNMTAYSHWDKWSDSRVGIVPNNELIELIDTREMHIIPLAVFIRKFPSVSKNVMDKLNARTKYTAGD